MTEEDYDLIDVKAAAVLSADILDAIDRHYRRRAPHSRATILETLNALAAVAIKVIASTDFNQDAKECFSEAVLDQMSLAQRAKMQ